ncbi:MAG: N-acetylmuramoyl-L-alanine amidase, partial [Oxalobacter sp.]|nr:N-acetylmuramoyl-L-alanine amidase [Oxalobacter sp.]
MRGAWMMRFFVIATLACACLSAYARDCLIAVDAGHTREEQGATSARGIGEWHFNIALAKRLAVLLDKAGIPYV